ncbi:MAG: hypothetical protein BWY05_01320 [Euryarchaeota archaeon ADurb.Bin165]|nr:MAG: hypothetical protein BWY05_01320 [Euryarchaeota archaeon ADurb.Bin165]
MMMVITPRRSIIPVINVGAFGMEVTSGVVITSLVSKRSTAKSSSPITNSTTCTVPFSLERDE